jgi:hypothetical protein
LFVMVKQYTRESDRATHATVETVRQHRFAF